MDRQTRSKCLLGSCCGSAIYGRTGGLLTCPFKMSTRATSRIIGSRMCSWNDNSLSIGVYPLMQGESHIQVTRYTMGHAVSRPRPCTHGSFLSNINHINNQRRPQKRGQTVVPCGGLLLPSRRQSEVEFIKQCRLRYMRTRSGRLYPCSKYHQLF